MTASFYTINKKIIERKTTLKMANFLIFVLFIKPNKNVIRRMIRLRLVVFLLSGNKHFFVGKWINVQWILFSRSRTVNFPYIVPSPAGPRVSPYSSESPDQLPVGLLGQLVDCCNGIAKARVRIMYKSEFFWDFLFTSALKSCHY